MEATRHHLCRSKTIRCSSILYGQNENFWSTAFGIMDVQGAVYISFVEDLCPLIEDRGIIVAKRAQWIIKHIEQIELVF